MTSKKILFVIFYFRKHNWKHKTVIADGGSTVNLNLGVTPISEFFKWIIGQGDLKDISITISGNNKIIHFLAL